MIIAGILSPVHSLGPGERICLWTQGCKKRCKGCISPELQPYKGHEVDEENLAKIIMQIAQMNHCTGVTISGGDPFEQPQALLKLLILLRKEFNDILVYTGFELQEIQSGLAGTEAKKCPDYLDVLIDGRYVEELNNNDCVLRGSSNQNIYFFNEELIPKYEEYMKQGRILESFVHNREIIITGILNKGD